MIPGISKIDNNGNSASAVEGTEYVEMEDNVCGDSATFTLSKDGVLTISRSGSIYDSDKHLFGWAFYKDDIKKIIVENGITSIGDGAFNDCQAEEVEIADTVTKVSDFAFSGCRKLKRIVIPEAVNYLGVECFVNCDELEEVIINGSIERLASNMFKNCQKLKKVVLPDTVKSIGTEAFLSCYELSDLNVPSKLFLLVVAREF